MDVSTITEGFSGFMNGNAESLWNVQIPWSTQALIIVCALGFIVLIWIVHAILVGALARSKGYAFFGNFLLGLLLGLFALIYQAGRPVSYERECVMQDRLALQTAKELYKLQRAREKAGGPPRSEG